MSQIRRRSGALGVTPVGAVGGAASSRLWTPEDIGSDLSAWFDADAGLTLNGSKVTQWTPRAGTLKTTLIGTQGNAGGQPTLINTNGYNALAFAGYQYYDLPANLMPTLAVPMCFMVAYNRVGTSSDSYGRNFRWGDNQTGFTFEIFQSAGFTGYTTSFSGATIIQGPSFFSYQWFKNGAPNYETNGQVMTYNGIPFAISSKVNTGSNQYNSGQAMLGNLNGYTPAGSEYMYVGFALARASALNSDIIARWEGYYAARMNGQSSLPANHPYKSKAPTI